MPMIAGCFPSSTPLKVADLWKMAQIREKARKIITDMFNKQTVELNMFS